MHELTLLSGLINQIEKIAREENASRVSAVYVRLGALAHISEDHFKEHFEDAVQGTIAAAAKLYVTKSDDITDPTAQDIVLESLELETDDEEERE